MSRDVERIDLIGIAFYKKKFKMIGNKRLEMEKINVKLV